MTQNISWGELVDIPIFVPSALLVVVVTILQQTAAYDIYGIYAIFAAFTGGDILAVISLGLLFLPERFMSRSFAAKSFLLGLILIVTAVLLYLVYGCVFGYPG